MATRQRLIYSANVDWLLDDKRTFRLSLETEAGTYVKEFVHGDFGRTQPNLSSVIGDCQTDIIELDVTVILFVFLLNFFLHVFFFKTCF